MLNLTQFGALSTILLAIVVGELISNVSKGRVPGTFTSSVLLLIGFWTILPADLAETAGINVSMLALCMLLPLVHLGTTISRKEMIAQWRTVLISFVGVAAICLVSLTLGAALFGWTTAAAATPTLTGAAVATMMMQQAAAAIGDTRAALVAVTTMAMQGLVGYPIAAACLRREAARLQGIYASGSLEAAQQTNQTMEKQANVRFSSTALILLKLSVLALAAVYLEKLTGGYVSKYVWCLLLGFAAHEFGILEASALSVAKSDGILITLLMGYLFCTLSSATPDTFFQVAGIALALVVLGAAAMGLFSWILSKITKGSFFMTYSIMLNAYFGFPFNVTLTTEAINASTDDPAVRKALSDHMMPQMLIGGFVSVTIVSVLVAGVLVNML